MTKDDWYDYVLRRLGLSQARCNRRQQRHARRQRIIATWGQGKE